MKSPEEIDRARTILCENLRTPGLTDVQKASLAGMLNAIVWVADGPGATTMNRLLGGEQLDIGKDHRPAMERLRRKTEG